MTSGSQRIELALTSAGVPGSATSGGPSEERTTHRGDASATLHERSDTIGWGLVFLLVGALVLPSGQLEYGLVAGVGALMLGLNAALVAGRRTFDLFTTVLGATALVAGVGALAGLKIDAFALFFILLGSVMVSVPFIRSAARPR